MSRLGGRRVLRAGAVALAAVAGLALTGALTAAARPAQAHASVTSIPGSLDGVSAVSASDVWAVGSDQAGTLIVHWNGTAWSQVKSPQLFDGVLDGVSMVSASNGWAVGNYFDNSTAKNVGLMLHWNGTKWVRVVAPSGTVSLTGVHMVSATDGWAVGGEITSSGGSALVLHWNGTNWVRAAIPALSSGGPAAVGATSASNAWAVGSESASFPAIDTLTLHWDGTAWTQVPSPSPSSSDSALQAVSATSASNAWAVGQYFPPTGPVKTLTLHWDGTAWTQVPSPSPGNISPTHFPANDLAGVAALSASNAWAVGDYFTRVSQGQQAPQIPLVLHWNGAKWVRVTVPGTFTDTGLSGITMVSPSDGWAVGQNFSTVEVLHWYGTTWS
jgi:hypothetical protein